jgi:DNA primase
MRIASMSGVKEEVISNDVERKRKRLMNAAKRTEQRQEVQPGRMMQPSEKKLHYEDVASALAEEGLIRLLYLEHELVKKPGLPDKGDFSSPALANIYSALRAGLERGEHVTVDTLAAALEKDEISLLVAILQKPEVLKRSEQSLADYIDKIKDRKQFRSGKADLNDLQKQLQKTKGYGR